MIDLKWHGETMRIDLDNARYGALEKEAPYNGGPDPTLDNIPRIGVKVNADFDEAASDVSARWFETKGSNGHPKW